MSDLHTKNFVFLKDVSSHILNNDNADPRIVGSIQTVVLDLWFKEHPAGPAWGISKREFKKFLKVVIKKLKTPEEKETAIEFGRAFGLIANRPDLSQVASQLEVKRYF